MQRLVSLLIVITAACGGGPETGEATLSGAMPPVKSASAKTFSGADGAGTMVLGWKIELYEDSPGADCLSDETNVVASIGIFTNQAAGSKPQALLQTGGISIVTMSPPTVIGNAAATMGVMGVSNVVGQVIVDEFHLTPDAMHADRIKGTISAGGTDSGTSADVSLTGTFTAPACIED